VTQEHVIQARKNVNANCCMGVEADKVFLQVDDVCLELSAAEAEDMGMSLLRYARELRRQGYE